MPANVAPAIVAVSMIRYISVPRLAGRKLLSATDAAYSAKMSSQRMCASGKP